MDAKTVLASAGYEVAYKGKWHLSSAFDRASASSRSASAADAEDSTMLSTWGFPAWTAPDAGTSLSSMVTLGGGVGANDSRIISGVLDVPRRAREALGAIASGGPEAWRVVEELLCELARSGGGRRQGEAGNGGGGRGDVATPEGIADGSTSQGAARLTKSPSAANSYEC